MYKFSELCNSRYFIVPPNQRGYSWNPENVDAVFSDLSLAGTQAHYMGPVIVTRTGAPDFTDGDLNTTAEFTLEDGQQRLTTFFIIANELLKGIVHHNGGVHDIESQELERLIFFKRVQGGPLEIRIKNSNANLDQYFSYILTGQPAPPAVRTPPMTSLERIRGRVQLFFSDKDRNELLVWKRKIINQAKFIWVDLASESVNRYLTFDAINSRGLPLSEFDKIKNFCILVTTHCGIYIQPETEWYKAISKLEFFKVSSRADEAAYISELYAAFFDDRVSQGGVHEAFVNRFRSLLTARDQNLENLLKEFIEHWEPMAHSFGFITTPNRAIHYPVLCSQDAAKWLNRLDNLELQAITRVLLTACHKKLSQSQFQEVVRACEILTFRVYATLGTRKDTHAKHINHLAHEVLRAGRDSIYVLQNLCLWLSKLSPMKEFLEKLSDGKAKYYNDPDIKGWRHCYYFLYEYELHNSPLGVAPVQWESSEEGKYNTQEHILPKTHRDGAWWQLHWPDEAEADRFKHRLGNLTLTSNNSALARKPIMQKINDPGAIHYYTHQTATNSEKRVPLYTNGLEWRPSNILKREYAMLEFAASRWSIPCCSDNGIFRLPREFVEEEEELGLIQINSVDCVTCADPKTDVIVEPEEGDEVPVVELSHADSIEFLDDNKI
jgi:hypothetical protein